MLDRLEYVERRYDELSMKLAEPGIIAHQKEWQKLMKEHASLEEIVQKYREYRKVRQELQDAQDMLGEKQDKELQEMIEAEQKELQETERKLAQELQLLLVPKDPNDDKNVVIEIRGGAGGEEAALFGADLFRMYTRYAERHGWKVELLNSNFTDIGGVKEVVFIITGVSAFSRLKYESGVHRVQRIPSTESGGRIHTSTTTVAVLAEAEDVDVEIGPNDLRVDVYRSGGHGGQSVNTTDSAVRITHLPTGLVVICQDEKSQLKNKDKALRVLKARLLDLYQSQQDAAYSEVRKNQVGTGDRSERIRTYNFPQGRVTDHRIGLTIYRLDAFLDGDCDEMMDALILTDRMEKLKQNG